MKLRFIALISFILMLTSQFAWARPQEPYTGWLAQSYANQWVDNYVQLRNPNYVYFENDCTNFVSQSLRAGGWRNTSVGSPSSDLYWYYVSSTQYSQTWSVAHSLYRRFANGYESWYGGFVITPSTMKARIGDIIFADWTCDGYIDHSMIVTATTSAGDPYVSYHSTDRENLAWSSLLAMFPPPSYTPKFYRYRKDL